MTERDSLSAHGRVLEAVEHLARAKEFLSGEDDELIDLLDEVKSEVATVGEILDIKHENAENRWLEGDG